MLAGGCYAPQPPEGAPCTSNGACPAPLACSAGHCVAEIVRDARSDGSAIGSDGPAACTPILVGSGALSAPAIPTPAIDGKLADWPTCFISMDSTSNPTRDLGANGMFPSGRFSVARDSTHIYFAAEVMGVLPLGDQPPPAIYQNNSISFYVDGDGHPTAAAYGPHAAQIVIDHAGQVQSFRSGTTITLPDMATAAKTSQATYTIEMAILPSTLGMTSFGSSLGFDIGFEGGDGTTQTSEVIWFESCGPPACVCTNASADDAPFCDGRDFGTVAL